MIDAAALAQAPATDAEPGAADGGWARPMLDRQLQVLGDLAEIGLELARQVEAEAKGPGADLDAAVLAYARVSRAVRQTIMLQAKLIAALQDQEKAETGRKASARASVARLVRRAIEDEAGRDVERAERLAREAAERLEREDFSALLSRPFGEIVADICRDLSLSPDWLRLAEDCALAEAALAGKTPPPPPEDDDDVEYEVRWLDSEDDSS